jgi:hypothetical protein
MTSDEREEVVMIKKGRLFLQFAAAMLLITCSTFFPNHLAYAGEGYGNHYPGGQEDFAIRLQRPAGLLITNYFELYNSGTLRDNAGRKVTMPGLGDADFKLNVVSNSTRFIRLTPYKVLGGNVSFCAIIPFVNVHTSLAAGPVDMGSQSKTGLGDIEVGAGLTWFPSKTFYHGVNFDIIAPTGAYDKDDMANIGRNYWSFNPFYTFSYLGDKDSLIPGLEVSAKVMYWINTINSATSYTSGQEFSTDYLVGQHFGNWRVGANGHFLYQTTDDKQYGTAAVDPFTGIKTGVRGKFLSAGPIVSYRFPSGGFLSVKYQSDVIEKNRTEGEKFWFNLTWPF